jgi:hypothetical protein
MNSTTTQKESAEMKVGSYELGPTRYADADGPSLAPVYRNTAEGQSTEAVEE